MNSAWSQHWLFIVFFKYSQYITTIVLAQIKIHFSTQDQDLNFRCISENTAECTFLFRWIIREQSQEFPGGNLWVKHLSTAVRGIYHVSDVLVCVTSSHCSSNLWSRKLHREMAFGACLLFSCLVQLQIHSIIGSVTCSNLCLVKDNRHLWKSLSCQWDKPFNLVLILDWSCSRKVKNT